MGENSRNRGYMIEETSGNNLLISHYNLYPNIMTNNSYKVK